MIHPSPTSLLRNFFLYLFRTFSIYIKKAWSEFFSTGSLDHSYLLSTFNMLGWLWMSTWKPSFQCKQRIVKNNHMYTFFLHCLQNFSNELLMVVTYHFCSKQSRDELSQVRPKLWLRKKEAMLVYTWILTNYTSIHVFLHLYFETYRGM